MPAPNERILVVENNPAVGKMLTQQTLVPAGYQVRLAADAAEAIQQALEFQPEALIANLSLPGLSGKDLLVALSSQGIDAPVIVIAAHGQENSIIQAFRLGASDYLIWPFQETEVITVLEHALEQVRSRRQREKMTGQLRVANQDLQRRLQEMNNLNLIGKTILAETDPQALFERLVEAGIVTSEADCGWLQVREEPGKPFILAAQHGLPARLAAHSGQTWEDAISATCAHLGEALALSGEALGRFLRPELAQAALAVPLKIRNDTLAVLVVTRRSNQPFSHTQQNMLKSITENVVFALNHSLRQQALARHDQTTQEAHLTEQVKSQLLQNTWQAALPLLEDTTRRLEDFARAQTGRLGKTQVDNLRAIYNNLQALKQHLALALPEASLNEFLDHLLGHFRILARLRGIALTAELPVEASVVPPNFQELWLVLNGLLEYSLQTTPGGGSITLSLKIDDRNNPQIKLNASPTSLPVNASASLFEHQPDQPASSAQGAVNLPLIARLCELQGWQLKTVDEQGLSFHLYLHHPEETR